jgi:hypothetical protein
MKKLEPCVFLMDMKKMLLLYTLIWRFLKKIKIEIPYDSATPLSEYLTKRIKIVIS